MMPRGYPIKSYMFFSGQIEFGLLSHGFDIGVLTNKMVIFDFWKHALDRPWTVAMHAAAMHKHSTCREVVHTYQQEWMTYREPYMRAAIFYLLNRYSNTGTIAHGDFDTDNFNAFSLETLKRMADIEYEIQLQYYPEFYVESGIKYANPEDILLFPAGAYAPPMLLRGVSEGVDQYVVRHHALKEHLLASGNKFVLCYKKNLQLLPLYRDFNLTYITKYGSVTSRLEKAEEIIINNF